ncbi:hypothetical protein OF83DRAFT_1172577 [Amylostereum chailletii]|nr:hypothetical protein OF83DRAFT_1172577 [Amylostereum chailletii]
MKPTKAKPSTLGCSPHLRADKLRPLRLQTHARCAHCSRAQRRPQAARASGSLYARKIVRLKRMVCALQTNAAEEQTRMALELEEARRSVVDLERERAEIVDAMSRAVTELSSFSTPFPEVPSKHVHRPSPERSPSPLSLPLPVLPLSLLDSRRHDLQLTIDMLQSRLGSAECETRLLRALADEAQRYASSLEDTHAALLACRDALLHDLHAHTIELQADLRASRIHEAHLEIALREAQDALAVADVEGVERLAREVEEAVGRAEEAEAELVDLRVRLEGAERNAVASTNRIVKLEAETGEARRKNEQVGAENVGLWEEANGLKKRLADLGATLEKTQARLAAAESTAREATQELEEVRQAHIAIPDEFQSDLDDFSDTSDISVDTLVTGVDDLSFLDEKYASSSLLDIDEAFLLPSPPSSSASTTPPPSPPTPALVRSLEAQLAVMALRYEAAEAARVCGDDVEDALRAQLRQLREENEQLRKGTPRRPKSSLRVRFAVPIAKEYPPSPEVRPMSPSSSDDPDDIFDEVSSLGGNVVNWILTPDRRWQVHMERCIWLHLRPGQVTRLPRLSFRAPAPRPAFVVYLRLVSLGFNQTL